MYRACGVPILRTLFVQAQGADVQSGVLEERIGEAGVLVRDFTIDVTHMAKADSAAVLGAFGVSGVVRDVAGHAVSNAQVRMLGTPRFTTTDNSGEFRMSGLPGGTQSLEVVALGYYPRRSRVELAQQMPPVSITLEHAAAILDSIRVVAQRVNGAGLTHYREFETRRASGVGTYLTEDDIAKRHPREMIDMFQTVPGVHLVYGNDGQARLAVSRGVTTLQGIGAGTMSPRSIASPDVYQDGNLIPPGELNTIQPGDVHGIEVYTVATMPVGYRHDRCGAVMIWTK